MVVRPFFIFGLNKFGDVMQCKNCGRELKRTTKNGHKSVNIYWINKGFCNQICGIEYYIKNK